MCSRSRSFIKKSKIIFIANMSLRPYRNVIARLAIRFTNARCFRFFACLFGFIPKMTISSSYGPVNFQVFLFVLVWKLLLGQTVPSAFKCNRDASVFQISLDPVIGSVMIIYNLHLLQAHFNISIILAHFL